MNAMTRTPVTVDEMVNGDLIARALWGDAEAATFIGRIPSNPRLFVIVPGHGTCPFTNSDGGDWFRLTEPATLCKYCGQEIVRRGINGIVGKWLHAVNYSLTCEDPTHATPAEVTP